jgi:hypothetical protein
MSVDRFKPAAKAMQQQFTDRIPKRLLLWMPWYWWQTEVRPTFFDAGIQDLAFVGLAAGEGGSCSPRHSRTRVRSSRLGSPNWSPERFWRLGCDAEPCTLAGSSTSPRFQAREIGSGRTSPTITTCAIPGN